MRQDMKHTTYEQIDKLWKSFIKEGISNPLTIVEQCTYLIICRMLDELESNRQQIAESNSKSFKALWFGKDQQQLRWHNFIQMDNESLFKFVRNDVFPFLRKLDQPYRIEQLRTAGRENDVYIAICTLINDIRFTIRTSDLLIELIEFINSIDMNDYNSTGKIYEYFLAKLSASEKNKTLHIPNNIQEAIIAILDPQPRMSIVNMPCGTSDFMIGAIKHINKSQMISNSDSKKNDEYLSYAVQQNTFRGFDVNKNMLLLSSINMLLHGVKQQCIFPHDVLADSFVQTYSDNVQNVFDIIFATPPWGYKVNMNDIAPELIQNIKTNSSELLYIVRTLTMLKHGGRCAIIVPENILSSCRNTHILLRKLLLDDNQVDAIISLPQGTFSPYTNIKTSIIIFTKGGKSKDVFYFDVQDVTKDIPSLLVAWKTRNEILQSDSTYQDYFVPADKIREQEYHFDLGHLKNCISTLGVLPRLALGLGLLGPIGMLAAPWLGIAGAIGVASGAISTAKVAAACGAMANSEPVKSKRKTQYVPLEQCVDFLNDLRQTVSKSTRQEGEYLYYGASGEQGTIDNFIFDEDLILIAEIFDFSKKNNTELVHKISGKTWVNKTAHVLRPKNNIDIDYLYSALVNSDLMPYAKGTAMAKLSRKDVEEIEIPLPSLDEQKNIVGKLRESLVKIQEEAEMLKKLQQQYFE